MSTLDRHKFLTPNETSRILDLLGREAIVTRARGHRLPVRDAMLIRLAIVSGLCASEPHVASNAGVQCSSGESAVGVWCPRDFTSVVGLPVGIILLGQQEKNPEPSQTPWGVP